MDSKKLPITGPCPIDLDAIGFDRSAGRSHCSHCDKSVHNLSTMTEAGARAFLREHAGEKLCVTYARDDDGVVQFRPERASAPAPTIVPLTQLTQLTRRTRRPAAAAAGFGLFAALAACTPHGDEPAKVEDKTEHEIEAGGIMAPEDVDEKGQDTAVPCDKDAKGKLEVVEGEMPVEKIAPPDMPVLGGAMVVPEPLEMADGEMEVPLPPEPEAPLPTRRGRIRVPDHG